jgi:CubicO group peptidase (beta-lactamase class C family)
MVLDSNGENVPSNTIPLDKAMIRFAHFVNNGGDAEFIVPGLLPQTLKFGQVGAYSMVLAADHVYSVRYVSSFLPLKTGAVSLTGGKYYTLVLRKSLPDPLSGYADITGSLIVDENEVLPQGKAAVRFVNYIEGGADKFDIAVGNIPSQRRIPYDGYSQYVTFSLSDGSKPSEDLMVFSHYYPDTIYKTISGFEDTLMEKTVYTMWVAGGPNPSQIMTFLTVDFGNATNPSRVAADAFENMVMSKMTNNFAGLSIALTDTTDSRYPIVYASAFGYRSIINRWRLTVNARLTVPGIASLMVYTLGMKAIDEGMLDHDDALADVLKVKIATPAIKPSKLKKLKDGKVTITLHDLFTHTTGFRDNYNVYKNMAVFKDDSDMDLCDFVMNYISKNGDYYDEKNFGTGVPGQDFTYNNVDATVLACILEKKYNNDFMDIAMEEIFMSTIPMPMSNTYYSYANRNPRIESQLFARRANGGFDQISPLTWPVWPAYNLRSTPSDLAMFLDNIVGRNGARILSPAAVDQMLTPYSKIDTGFSNLQIAYGWMVMTGVSANPLYGHPVLPEFPGKDRACGASGHAWYDRVNGQGVVILANTDDDNNMLPDILMDAWGAFSALKNTYARPPECNKIGTPYECERVEECHWIRTNVCVKAEPDLP